MTVIATKIPALRFPEFEGEWEEKRLGEVFDFYQTNSFSRSLLSYEIGEVKNIHYGDIHTKFKTSFDVSKEDVPFVDESVDLSRIADANYCRVGDLIIADASEDYKDVGKAIEVVNLAGYKLLAGLHTLIVRDVKNQTATGFKGYMMQARSIRLQVMRMATGISVLGISKGNLAKIILFLPHLHEQQKIAAFLTTIDTRIQQLSRKKALLEQYKKGVMQQIFSQEIRFNDEEGKEFPAWEEKKLGALTYKVGIKNKHGANLPIYSINNKEGFLPQSDQFEGVDSHERGYDISLYKVVNANTFAYNPARINVGSIGYSGNLNEVIISSLYVCFKTKEMLDDKFLLSYLNTYKFNKAVLRNAEGGVRSYLFYENFSNIKIPLPSPPEQQKIATFLSTIDRQINLVGQQLERMQTFKKGLLQQMFV